MKDLAVAFCVDGVQRTAVDRVSFTVFPGEIVGVLGESNSGKTTIGRAILGLVPPEGHVTGGSVEFCGAQILGLSESKMRSIRGIAISLISQEPRIALNPVMRVGTQVAEVVRAHHSWNSSRCRETAIAVLNEVRLDANSIYDAFPHELSGGQCQRVAIAQALACRPQLVIADEPTSSLDSTVQSEVLELLAALRERHGIAFLLITHNPAIVAKYADRVLVMNKGQIVEQGVTMRVLDAPSHPYTKMLLGSRGSLLGAVAAPRS